jgi:hypothetical protein
VDRRRAVALALLVLTDGVRVVLELDGRRDEYRSGRGRSPFGCPVPEKPVGESPPSGLIVISTNVIAKRPSSSEREIAPR